MKSENRRHLGAYYTSDNYRLVNIKNTKNSKRRLQIAYIYGSIGHSLLATLENSNAIIN